MNVALELASLFAAVTEAESLVQSAIRAHLSGYPDFAWSDLAALTVTLGNLEEKVRELHRRSLSLVYVLEGTPMTSEKPQATSGEVPL